MSIVDKNFVFDKITNNQVYKQDQDGKILIEHDAVKYRWTHGATDYHLGDGLLVYAMIQNMRAKNCVCLGSGAGFIPRIMTQARIDLHDQGIFEGKPDFSWGDIGATFIVDAANGIGGEVDWLKEDSFLRKIFHPRIVNDTTEKAYYDFFVKEDIKIDYLHIDAGHSYENVKQDFTLYSKILNPNGIISIHDTDLRYANKHIVTKDVSDLNNHEEFANGPAKFIKEISDEWQRFDFHNHGILNTKPSSTGLTIFRRA
ncbi:class I SAM-dependent methyltransferase [bacterium]|nr:class I SAM-dependent methyltransferase [bacterium]